MAGNRSTANVGGAGTSTSDFLYRRHRLSMVANMCCAPAVSEQQYFPAFPEGRSDQLRDLHDPVGMFTNELLLDSCAFVEGLQHKLFHRSQF